MHKKVFEAVCAAGAGNLGDYSHCTFSAAGQGTFKPRKNAQPFIGTPDVLETVSEIKLEFIADNKKCGRIIQAMLDAHPYECPAYDVYRLENKNNAMGLARIGHLASPCTLEEFCLRTKSALQISNLRFCGDPKMQVFKIAVSSGSGGASLERAIQCGADVLVTGDIKHNVAMEAQTLGIALIDAGHYETEHIIMNKLICGLQLEFDKLECDTELIISSAQKAVMQFI